MREKGDLNRKSTHKLRTYDGMRAKRQVTQDPSVAKAIEEKLLGKEESC